MKCLAPVCLLRAWPARSVWMACALVRLSNLLCLFLSPSVWIINAYTIINDSSVSWTHLEVSLSTVRVPCALKSACVHALACMHVVQLCLFQFNCMSDTFQPAHTSTICAMPRHRHGSSSAHATQRMSLCLDYELLTVIYHHLCDERCMASVSFINVIERKFWFPILLGCWW